MPRVPSALVFLLWCAAGLEGLRAQTPSTGGAASEELRLIRQLLEQQAKQLETLTQQVTRLSQHLEESRNIPSPVPAATRDTPPISSGQPSGTPQPPPGSTPTQRTHIVSKGETLTLIAKQYNITVAELLAVNTVTDDRKLQIGQILVLPESAHSESPPKPIEDQ